MSREEAIDLLDNLIGMIEDNHESDYDTVFKMAIQALEQEPKYCDRNICLKNEYNGIGCDECEVGNPCLYCKHEFEPQERSE